jgi:murein DD-endopeptidase MepM/ murein hydrolase activator NlpD
LHPAAGHFHDGIDLPAVLGAPVRAVAPGTLIRVQRKGLGGLEMLVQHDGFIGVYSHLGLIAPAILEGRRTLAAGQQLGTVGRSGMTSGPHMFFAMLINGKPVDPAPYLQLPPCGREAPRTPTG